MNKLSIDVLRAIVLIRVKLNEDKSKDIPVEIIKTPIRGVINKSVSTINMGKNHKKKIPRELNLIFNLY